MQLTFNDLPLHDYGQIVISSQSSVGEPESAPQAWRNTMRVRIMFKEPSYSDNYALVQQVRAALKSKQQGVLKWVDDAGNELLNQTATIVGHDRPEKPNEKGTYFQTIEITFQYYDLFGSTQNNSIQATFKRTGPSTPTITLGYVERFKYDTDVRRYSPLRSHREMASGKISVSGKFRADPLASVDDRRQALLFAADLMRVEVATGMDGEFKFASFDEVVRIENFTADYDQHMDAIAFSLTATFTQFPNESSYAQAEFSVDERQDVKEGKVIKTLSGAILANSKDAAVAKLNSIRSAFTTGFTMLRGGGGREEYVNGDDGETFIRLSFDEEFEKTTSHLVEWELHISDADDVTAGTIRRTYSGHVTATDSTFLNAYNTATGKARYLGENKHQFKLTGTISCDDKQFSADRQLLGNFVVTVEFAFEYKLKTAKRIYCEISSEFAGDTYGLDIETVSGFVIGATGDDARAIYNTIKSGYSGYSMRSDRVTESRSKIAKDTEASLGVTKSPPNSSGTYSVDVNTNSSEVSDTTETIGTANYRGPLVTSPLGSSYARQWVRLDFSFSILRKKSNISIRYELAISSDYVQRTITTTMSGVVTAPSGETGNTNNAEDALTTFMDDYATTLGLGGRIASQRSFSYEKENLTGAPKFTTRNATDSTGSTFAQLSFTDTYVRRMTGRALILEASVKEDIECSGDRIVVQPTAQDDDVFQTCGYQSGKRVVSGSVTATDETAAFAFISKQKTLSINTAHVSNSETSKTLPPKYSIEYKQVPLKELVVRNPNPTGDDYEPEVDNEPTEGWEGKATVVVVSFSFEEVFASLTVP